MAKTHKIDFDRFGRSNVICSPFFPFIREEDEQKKISFNQGYVFAYSKPDPFGGPVENKVKKIIVEGCEERNLSNNEYYINIKVDEEGNATSASISDQEGEVSVPICSIEQGTSIINELFVRENIHFFMGSGSGYSGSGTGSGYMRFVNCLQEEQGKIEWSEGRISTNGEFTFNLGNCGGGGGGSGNISGSGINMYFIKDGYLKKADFLVLPETVSTIGPI